VFVSDNLSVNQDGHLSIGGLDALTLAKEYGTPLYVMDENIVRRSCALYRTSIENFYDGNGLVLYASKALCCKEMCRIAKDERLGLDVVSGGEIYTAVSAGFPAEKMYFHGNNKTAAEISYALDCGVGHFVVDNIEELMLLNSLAGEKAKVAAILFRIKPGVDAHTHDFIRTGQIDSKFGFALETGEAEQAIKQTVGLANIHLVGVGCHIGSQIFEISPFEETARIMVGFMADMRDKYGVKLRELDLGGGFGIKYLPKDDPIEYNRYMEEVSVVIKRCCKEHGLDLPFIVMEPGRSIVASAGTTLYTVGSVKEIPGIRTYVAVDGGMTDNPRYALYQAPYDAAIADRAGAPKDKTVTLAGRCCESGDLIAEHIKLQAAKAGDTLAVFATGAYNYSMASNYNRVPRLAMIMIKDGSTRVMIKRETYEDIIRNDI
jgi:diaminopimelate decarboxylase